MIEILDELISLYNILGERTIFILIHRNGNHKETLEEIGDFLGITRERVRQLEKKGERRIINRYLYGHLPQLRLAFKKINLLGDDFSYSAWKSHLDLKDIQRIENTNCDELLIMLMKVIFLSEVGAEFAPEFRDLIKKLSPDAYQTTLRTVKQIFLADSVQDKNINKYVKKFGAISKKQACTMLKVEERDITTIMEEIGYLEICKGWYIKSNYPKGSYRTILNAADKMILHCPQLTPEEFYLGLQNHMRRSRNPLAPLLVVMELLNNFGFRVVDGMVIKSEGGQCDTKLNAPEEIFIKLLQSYNFVVTYYELAEEFLQCGLSLGSLSNTLINGSPLINCISERPRLFTLRGIKPTQESIHDAIKRQQKIQPEIRVNYNQNGTISFYITITNYSLYSGMIPATGLPVLAQTWQLQHKESQRTYSVSIINGLITGFKDYFYEHNIKTGQRIQIQFDVLHSQIWIKLEK